MNEVMLWVILFFTVANFLITAFRAFLAWLLNRAMDAQLAEKEPRSYGRREKMAKWEKTQCVRQDEGE